MTVSISIANVEDVISALKYIFNIYQKFVKIYCDDDQHFFNEKLKNWLKNQEIKLILSFFESSQSIELIKSENKFLKEILRKDSNKNWDEILKQFTSRLNSHIIEHLEFFSINIFMRLRSLIFAVDITFLFISNQFSVEKILHQLSQSLIYKKIVRNYFIYRAQIHDHIRELFKKQKKKEVERFNRRITKQIIHQIKSLIMLYQKKHIKLTFRWRNCFRIYEYEKTHQLSFVLNQLNDRKIREIFHENHLKEFKSRTKYLSNSTHEKNLLLYQTIKVSKAKKKRI